MDIAAATPRPPQLEYVRVSSDGSADYPEPDEALADPAFAAATTTVVGFAGFLERLGHSSQAASLDGLQLVLDASEPDNAAAGGGSISIGTGGDLFPRGVAYSPEIVGHELTHIVHPSSYLDWSEEGLADLLGIAYSRSAGHAPAADWHLADEAVNPRSEFAALAARRLDQPTLRTLADVDAYIGTVDLLDVDPHSVVGPLSAAVVGAAEHMTNDELSGVLADAIFSDIPALAAPEAAATASPGPIPESGETISTTADDVRSDLNVAARGIARALDRRLGPDHTAAMAFRAAAEAAGIAISDPSLEPPSEPA